MSNHNDYAAFIRGELEVKYGIQHQDLVNPPSWMIYSPDELIYDAAARLVALDAAKQELLGSTVSLLAIFLGGKPWPIPDPVPPPRIRI